jgi:uncharacterized protein (DUF305 family)
MLNTRVSTGAAGGLLAVSLVLTGCAGSTTTAPANPAPSVSSAAPSNAQHNDADVAFAQMMIPHHRDAVAMAELAADRAQDPEVKALAEQIQAAQQPEIEQLTGFLNAWGAEIPPSNSVEGMDHGSMPSASTASGMGGMMTPAQMEQLGNATGAQFDEMFLTMMIEHHRSAISGAQKEIAQGSNPDAKQLAEKIVADQTDEITRMQQMQAG